MGERPFAFLRYLDEGLSAMPVVRESAQVHLDPPSLTLDELNERMQMIIRYELDVNPGLLVLGVISTPYMTAEGVSIQTSSIHVRRREPETNTEMP